MGHLADAPQLHYTKSGIAVTTIQVATNPQKKDGVEQKPEYHSVVCWSKTAQNVCTYLKKGSGVYVEGRIKTAQWADTSGVKQYKKEIHAHTVNFLNTPDEEVGQKEKKKQVTKG